MKIFAYSGGSHCAGMTLLENGKPVFAFEEERFNRIKAYKDYYNHHFRIPVQSTAWAKKEFNLDFNDIDYVTTYYPELGPTGVYEAKEIFQQSDLGDFPQEKFIFTDHHDSHCYLAYYTSGFEEDTLVISLDASGGDYSGKFYLGKNGNLDYIDGLKLDVKSFGHYYALLTEFLGFKRLKDEGKIVGMASHGNFNQRYYDIFNKIIKVIGTQTDKESIYNDSTKHKYGHVLSKIYKDFYNEFFEQIGSAFYKHELNDIAYNGQLVFEEKIIELIQNLKKKTPTATKIAASGGVFANVKLNKRINELDWVEEVYITPPMGDEGCNWGCGLYIHKLKNPDFKPYKLNDVFLGVEFSDTEVGDVFWDKDKFKREIYYPEIIAKELKEGNIVGWFQGRYEHGPRALCNRTILADPSVPGTYKKINDKLQRNDFMPFAPVVLDTEADNVFHVTKSRYTAEFMTMLYDTKDEWKDKIKAVVHPVDGTARIQIVTPKSNNKFYDLLTQFHNLTQIPVLLNTSFNVHGEPIVCMPNEAFNHLENGIVDTLVINNFIYRKI